MEVIELPYTLFDLPAELILRIIFLLDVKSILLVRLLDKSFNDFHVKEILTILRFVLNRLTGFNTSQYSLEDLNNLSKLLSADISAGDKHSLVLNSKGDVYSFGMNNLGQLGIENNDADEHYPVFIPDLKECHKIYAIYHSSFALINDGKLYVIGDIVEGNYRNINNINKMAVAGNTVILMTKLGEVCVSVLGLSFDFEIISDKVIDITVNNYGYYLLNSNGSIECFGHHYGVQINLPNIIKIASDEFGFAAITSDGNVFWANSTMNITKMTLLAQLIDIVDISINETYALALDANNKVYVWAN